MWRGSLLNIFHCLQLLRQRNEFLYFTLLMFTPLISYQGIVVQMREDKAND